jgi:hypothetical protein
MSWNNRIFRHKWKATKGVAKHETFALHETFYADDGKTVEGYTEEPMCGHYESVDDLIKGLEQMLSDVKRSKDDILEYKL